MANGGVRFQSPIALRHSPDEEVVVLGRSGNDLLSRVLRHSTIGAEAFNGRVRDGIGFRRLAQITGPAKDISFGLRRRRAHPGAWLPAHQRGRAFALAGPKARDAMRSESASKM